MTTSLLLTLGLLLLLLLLALLFWWWRASSTGVAVAAPAPPALAVQARRASAALPAPPPAAMPVPAVLAALAEFRWRSADTLSPEIRELLLARLRGIRRPSRSFQQLVSPSFISTASTAEVAALVKGEPLVSARILARVNAPAYGLRQPLVQLEQAIAFMGLNAVRSLCIQYLLDESFKAESPVRQAALDAIWRASTLSGEIALRLGQGLGLPEPAQLSTRVVLSFIGHLAAATLLPASQLAALQQRSGAGLLDRVRLEQAQLGLPAAELGRLLLQAWSLPEALVDEVVGIDRLLLTPPEPAQAAARAVAYLAARWGEQLSPACLQAPHLSEEDGFHLQACLRLPVLQGWQLLTHTPDWSTAMERLLRTTAQGA